MDLKSDTVEGVGEDFGVTRLFEDIFGEFLAGIKVEGRAVEAVFGLEKLIIDRRIGVMDIIKVVVPVEIIGVDSASQGA